MRVVLADDQAWLRSAVRLLLEQLSNVETVGEAADEQHLRRLSTDRELDLVLLDSGAAGLNTHRAATCVDA